MRRSHLLFIILLASCTALFHSCEPQGPGSGTDVPVINLGQTDLSIGPDGGEVSIAYTLENPAETGVVSAASDVPWATLVNVSATDIIFKIKKNDVTEDRTAEITVVYTYGDDKKTVSSKATITQSEMIPDPEITVDQTEISVVPEGGEITVGVAVQYPASDGVLSASTEADWIEVSRVTDSEITLQVKENKSMGERTAQLSVTYSYGQDKTVETKVKIIQDIPFDSDYYLPEAYTYAEYYDYGEIFRYFRIYFSDREIIDGKVAADAFKYDLTIYVSHVADNENPIPPAGTYTYGKNLVPGEFSGWIYPANDTDGFEIKEGTMEITEDGEYLGIEINLTDFNGKTHYVKYYGIPSFKTVIQI